MKIKNIDRKAIQSGLSVFFCVAFGPLFHIQSLFYASIAAVITAQTDVMESFKVGRNRIYGTFIGVVIGIIFAAYYRGNALLCGVGVVVIIYIGHKIWGTPATNVACIAFIAIMLDIRPDDTPLEYGIYRFIDTAFGVVVSVFSSYLLFHNPILARLYKRNKHK